ncbi:hypothetical protein [Aquipuribacter sp. MA13-6]|uniref:hypothetical protein n=1 Tax=unclassified Aquipuribacter TaxID=2635084 RepID=UPI003EEAD4B9
MFPPPLLVFDCDDEVYAFRALATAEGFLESIDVLDGEYRGAFTTDGHVVTITGEPDGPVTLTLTSEVDRGTLTELLEAAANRRGRPWPSDDPSAVAAQLLHEVWEQRWPRRPRWLSRRLHGEEPTVPDSP